MTRPRAIRDEDDRAGVSGVLISASCVSLQRVALTADNSLLYFHQYQNALDTDVLAIHARTGTTIRSNSRDPNYLFDIFREDVRRGLLPQVSFIVAPEAYTEHPNWAPNWRGSYISKFIDILVEHADLWSKTVLLINYDEEGGFFDHMVPPTPPLTAAHGDSTVTTINEIFPGATRRNGTFFHRYGLGERVPMIVVSPWSKGGFVNSQLFDHTSVIQFLEARFAGANQDLIETKSLRKQDVRPAAWPWRDDVEAREFREPQPIPRMVRVCRDGPGRQHARVPADRTPGEREGQFH